MRGERENGLRVKLRVRQKKNKKSRKAREKKTPIKNVMLEKKRNTRHKETFADAEGFSSSDLYSSTAELHVHHGHLQNTTGPHLTLQHYLSRICHLQANTEPVIKTGQIKAV